MKSGCDRAHPDIVFQKKFDLCVPIKYKIRLLKAQVLKSYRTFVVQKSYAGRTFLLPEPKWDWIPKPKGLKEENEASSLNSCSSFRSSPPEVLLEKGVLKIYSKFIRQPMPKCDFGFLRICSHLLKKYLTENTIFCALKWVNVFFCNCTK